MAAMTSIHAEKCCHLVSAHEASAPRICSTPPGSRAPAYIADPGTANIRVVRLSACLSVCFPVSFSVRVIIDFSEVQLVMGTISVVNP